MVVFEYYRSKIPVYNPYKRRRTPFPLAPQKDVRNPQSPTQRHNYSTPTTTQPLYSNNDPTTLLQQRPNRQAISPAITLPPPSLPRRGHIVMIAGRMIRSPPAQSIPIPTHAGLIDACISMTRGIEQGIVSQAHDVLAEGVEAVHVVLCVPVRGGAGGEGHVVLADEFLFNGGVVVSGVWGKGWGGKMAYEAVDFMVGFDDIDSFGCVLWVL